MNKQELQKYLMSEIKQVISEQGLIVSDADVVNILVQIHDQFNSVQEIKLTPLQESFSIVPVMETEITVENVASDIKEVKKLSEEIQRMKHLMNFSSPLLKD